MEMGLLKDGADPEESEAEKEKSEQLKDEKNIRALNFGRLWELAYPEVRSFMCNVNFIILCDFPYLHLQRMLLILATIGLLFSSGINLVVIGMLGRVVDSFVSEDRTEGRASLLSSVLILFAIFIFGGLMTFLRATLFTIAGERVVLRLRKRLFARILEQDMCVFPYSLTYRPRFHECHLPARFLKLPYDNVLSSTVRPVKDPQDTRWGAPHDAR